MHNIVLGYGLLGKEIVKETGWDYLSREETPDFDFRYLRTYIKYLYAYDTIINCVANTNTYSDDKPAMLETNFNPVCKLKAWCEKNGKKLVHISTDYVCAGSIHPSKESDVPVHARTWYAYSKLLADGYIESFSTNYLIIRTSFKRYPFPYEKAIVKQKGNFDYVPRIAEKIINLINKNSHGIVNVGHIPSWNMYEMAKETKPDIKVTTELINKNMPRNITMDLSKMKSLLQ
jgi:dTDP-4-dehydrorhamnose reductase